MRDSGLDGAIYRKSKTCTGALQHSATDLNPRYPLRLTKITQPKFFAAKSQLTSFQNDSTYLGLALR